VQLGKTQLTEGTGLGLPISRRLSELLRGSLTLESQLGRGSTFRLSLPPNAERSNGARLSDQETTPRPADERGSAPRKDVETDEDEAPRPHAKSGAAS
jgi:histidine kinase/DNA gyrase B/HSP90-like ATPase